MKTTKMMLGIVAAAAAGVAIGMLIAPEKGSDLQKKIKAGAQDWMDEITKLINDKKKLVAGKRTEEERPIQDLSSN